MKVLFLTQWYPSRYDAMAGLFVCKHAEAVARQGVDVCVLYFEHIQNNDVEQMDWQELNGVKEAVVYYSGSPYRAMHKGTKLILQRWGMPDLCQVNVLSKNALIARFLQARHHVPYMIVEHWSGYLPANGNYLRLTPVLQRKLYEHLARKASCIMPVSNMLMKSMQDCGIRNNRWETVHNVVDDFFYQEHRRATSDGTFRLLHVSCFDEKAKNIHGILRAISLLAAVRQDFRLTIVGTGQNYADTRALSDELQLTDKFVFFRGEIPPRQVHQCMLEADAFVLFSRYETSGVVLAECLATGLPMIASEVGAIPEIVVPEVGRLVPSEDEKALAQTISEMLDHLSDYPEEQIKKYGKQYSYAEVGAHFKSVYESVLS